MSVHLADRHPQLDAPALAQRFVPPPRFSNVLFATYSPDPEHPSQAGARNRCEMFAASAHERGRKRLFRPAPVITPPGLYLDGGFGTGKTHLLASIWHAFNAAPKAYLTFTELTAFIGFAGMASAVATFSNHGLICIDEFELDDVASTLMTVSFLRGYLQGSQKVAVTSNTLPGRLGEDRFSADEFRREIRTIADAFDEIRVDGPDFRTSHAPLALRTQSMSSDADVAHDTFDELMEQLRVVHPVQYSAMLDGVDAVVIEEVHALDSQDDALRAVQFFDKIYDAHIPVRITGCAIDKIFHASYRNGGYSKKYGRAESRLVAMQAESAGLF